MHLHRRFPEVGTGGFVFPGGRGETLANGNDGRRADCPPRALTIAGSDSGGGAGIQADLKTFFALGVYGMSAVTAVTAQNSTGIQAVHPLPAGFVGQQIDAVVEDIGVDAVKTGMLHDAEIVRAVSERIRSWSMSRLVVDPVMLAKGGRELLLPAACRALREFLLPLALVVTPNVPEAEALAGMKINNERQARRAAAIIHGCGPTYVVLKGGHLPGPALDIIYDGRQYTFLEAERCNTRNTHGTGCTFSAAITAALARGYDVPAAARLAKEFVTAAIRRSFPLGRGHGPTNHWAYERGHPLRPRSGSWPPARKEDLTNHDKH